MRVRASSIVAWQAMLLTAFAAETVPLAAGSAPRPPGVVIVYRAAATGIYIGSPSLALLPDGRYVASHDEFGPGSSEHTRAISHIYRSEDRGATWRRIAIIEGAFWSTLFVHPDTTKHGFQYPDWQFDGEDLIAVVRTAFEDGAGGAHNAHDANFLTFHRWPEFRKLTLSDSVAEKSQ
jgi:hypothetical protein